MCQDTICISGRTSSHKIHVYFDLDTRTKLFSTPRHKANQFRSLNWNHVKWNQVNMDHPDENIANFDAHTKTKRFAARIQKPNQFRPPPPHKSKSIDHDAQNNLISARTRLISIPRTERKSLSIPTLKPSQIRSLKQKSSLTSTQQLKSC